MNVNINQKKATDEFNRKASIIKNYTHHEINLIKKQQEIKTYIERSKHLYWKLGLLYSSNEKDKGIQKEYHDLQNEFEDLERKYNKLMAGHQQETEHRS